MQEQNKEKKGGARLKSQTHIYCFWLRQRKASSAIVRSMGRCVVSVCSTLLCVLSLCVLYLPCSTPNPGHNHVLGFGLYAIFLGSRSAHGHNSPQRKRLSASGPTSQIFWARHIGTSQLSSKAPMRERTYKPNVHIHDHMNAVTMDVFSYMRMDCYWIWSCSVLYFGLLYLLLMMKMMMMTSPLSTPLDVGPGQPDTDAADEGKFLCYMPFFCGWSCSTRGSLKLPADSRCWCCVTFSLFFFFGIGNWPTRIVWERSPRRRPALWVMQFFGGWFASVWPEIITIRIQARKHLTVTIT